MVYLVYFSASAWQDCKELGIKWGGRGAGGRAAGRMTVQSYDVVVEGCTMAYLGTNLLDRTTLRLLQGKKYGLIGRNGVGKRYLLRSLIKDSGMLFFQWLALLCDELPVGHCQDFLHIFVSHKFDKNYRIYHLIKPISLRWNMW